MGQADGTGSPPGGGGAGPSTSAGVWVHEAGSRVPRRLGGLERIKSRPAEMRARGLRPVRVWCWPWRGGAPGPRRGWACACRTCGAGAIGAAGACNWVRIRAGRPKQAQAPDIVRYIRPKQAQAPAAPHEHTSATLRACCRGTCAPHEQCTPALRAGYSVAAIFSTSCSIFSTRYSVHMGIA
jgi:hypothetical protein